MMRKDIVFENQFNITNKYFKRQVFENSRIFVGNHS